MNIPKWLFVILVLIALIWFGEHSFLAGGLSGWWVRGEAEETYYLVDGRPPTRERDGSVVIDNGRQQIEIVAPESPGFILHQEGYDPIPVPNKQVPASERLRQPELEYRPVQPPPSQTQPPCGQENRPCDGNAGWERGYRPVKVNE